MAEIDSIGSNGLELKDYNTILDEIQTGMNEIYAVDGDQINFDSETPDGQLTNIYAQAMSDLRDTITEVYNSFDPQKCTGVIQDSRYALNYITRRGATFTVQNIDVTVNKTVTLEGLDANYADPNAASYTVSDDAGNLWYLIDTTTLTAGTTSLPFRSKNYGSFQSTIGTITNQVTIVLGVTSVINSVAATTLGEEQETDVEFRIRRERSTELRGLNNTDSMLSQILELDAVSDADVWCNFTNETDDTGTPANTVWVIVEGGANSDIADTIYANACSANFRGDIDVPVTAVSGQIFPVKFDRPNPVPLYIRFDFQMYVEQEATDPTAIVQYIADYLTYSLNEAAETSKITNVASEAIVANGGGGYALNVEVSTGGTATVSDIISATITSAELNNSVFQSAVKNTSGTYRFIFDGLNWYYNEETVALSNYGISYEGSASADDIIIIENTASAWTDYIESASRKNKFVVDTTRIFVNTIEAD